MGRSTPTAAHSVGTSTPAANTTVRDGKLPVDVSTPTTAASFVRNPRTDSPSRTCAPWRRAASMSASVTATGSSAPSRGRQIASRRATRRFGSRRLISSASASRSSAPSSSVSDSASSPQASDPLQRTRTPGTSRSSRAQSSSAVRRSGVLPSIASPALGPRTQAKESPVTPDAGSDRSMSNTAAPAQAAWYATEAPTMPAPTTTTSVTGAPRTRDSVPDGEASCPGRRWLAGTRASALPRKRRFRRLAYKLRASERRRAGRVVLSGTHEKRRPVACRQRSPRHRSTTLSWRLMMHPTVQSFPTPDGVVASALAS